MTRLLIAAAVSLLLADSGRAQTLTLREAAAEALGRNPQIIAASSEVDAARARLRQARATWLPLIDASASSSRSNNPVFVFASLLEQGRFAPGHFDPSFLNDPPTIRNDRLTFTVRYALFDQLRRYDVNKQAAHGVTRADRTSEETRQRVLYEVVNRYYGLAVAEQRRVVAHEAVRAAEAAAKATADKAEQGLVVESDRLAAEVQLAQFRQQEIAAAGDVEVARAALAMTLHRSLLERFAVEPSLPDRVLPGVELSAATEQAVAVRGEVAAAAAARAEAELQVRTARGGLLPRVDAFASWGASGSTFEHRNGDRTIGVIASVGVFDGGKFARISEARAALEGARAMEDLTRDKVVLETITAWNALNAARQQLEVANVAVSQAEAAARIVQDRYENGLTTITELLRAQTALVGARLALLAARHQSIGGYAELLRSTGGLRDIDPFL